MFKRTTIRIPEKDWEKMIKIKKQKGVPANLQLLIAWREKYEK